MLTNKHLKDFTVRATDGDLGKIEDVYFDDETWALRYLIVDTGTWLRGRRVLISPMSVKHLDWEGKTVQVALTTSQVEQSPGIDTHEPVFRQHEAEHLGYYGYPYYWGGPYLWGPAYYPGQASCVSAPAQVAAEAARKESADSHLRSTEAVKGYHIATTDGDIGHVDGFILDDEFWAIRYLEVKLNWLPGDKVLVSPTWIEKISWEDSSVFTGLTREAIKGAPAYIESRPITREYEKLLHHHYGQPPYWLQDSAYTNAHSLSSV
jgi:hypothetical protein